MDSVLGQDVQQLQEGVACPRLNKIYILFNLDCTKKMPPFLPGPVNDKSTGSIFSPVLLPLLFFRACGIVSDAGPLSGYAIQ